jgi:hypothetical protein
MDSDEAAGLVNRLFRNGHQYVGRYEHGVDCPILHEQTVADAFDLFEKVCLLDQHRVGIAGGISSGKSSVVHLLHFMMTTLCAAYGLPYMPILFTNRTQRAIDSADDFLTAYDELYGLINVVRNGQRFQLGSFDYFAEVVGSNFAKRRTSSLAAAQHVAGKITAIDIEPVLLVDDAHILPRFIESDERLTLGPNVEAIEAVFPRMVISTMRPEMFWEYNLSQVQRTDRYAALGIWYRGERQADTYLRLQSQSQFAGGLALDLPSNPRNMHGILSWCDTKAIAGIYVRTRTIEQTDRLQAIMPADIDCIPCDHRIERSEVSDQCWQAHRQGRRYVVLSAGGAARYHRSLPLSTGLFIDTTLSGTGIANAAVGYDRTNALVVLGDLGTTKVRARDTAHNRFRLTGTVRPELPTTSALEWYDWRLTHRPLAA